MVTSKFDEQGLAKPNCFQIKFTSRLNRVVTGEIFAGRIFPMYYTPFSKMAHKTHKTHYSFVSMLISPCCLV